MPDLRLAPQELKTATINIAVPKNAEPGGHFGVVRFTAVPPNLEGTGVALSASVGALILLRVAGAVTDKVSLAEFSTFSPVNPKDKKNRSFFETGPVSFLVRLRNEGTVHEKVQGSINVTDMFGKKVASVAMNDKGSNVLPASVRRFEQGLSQKQLLGLYTVDMKLSYLGGAQKLDGKLSFWVIPWKLILLCIIGLIVLVWLMRSGLRRYKARVIAQARRR